MFRSALIIGIVVLCNAMGFAQKDEKAVTTTSADSRYGEGGTTDITSQNYAVIRQVWKDAAGKKREVFDENSDEKGQLHQQWTFLSEDAKKVAGIFVYVPERQLFKAVLPYSIPWESATPAQVREWIDDIEKQFSARSTMPERWNKAPKTSREVDDSKRSDDLNNPPPLPPRPDPKPKAEPKPKPQVVKGLDPCLVGKWRSEKTGEGYLSDSLMAPSNEGIIFEVFPDGGANIDFSGVAPRVVNWDLVNESETTTTTITGRTVAEKILTISGSIMLGTKNPPASNVRMVEKMSNQPEPRIVERHELFLGENTAVYTCVGTVLRLGSGSNLLSFRKVE